ncbi:MAG: DUF559 domain-containing protein [Anaerolineales bacterium]|nr:DUF559 domain-containing protein [Anaerolineales bacterium]
MRGKKLDGIKFRRQPLIGLFVIDFYNSTDRLAVEEGGPIHVNQVESDLAARKFRSNLV